MSNDTIVALATPPGQGAIAVLRVSGERAFESVRALLSPAAAKKSFEPRKLYLCKLGNEVVLDHAMVAFFPAPDSYTGEDVAEVFCHGGEAVASRLIAAMFNLGCRLARPGEFTCRAVENDKMDLLQAEAVQDLVNAESIAAADNALRQLDGELSARIRNLRADLIHVAALLELELDFAEEDVDFAERQQIEHGLAAVAGSLRDLIGSYDKGRGLRRGIRVAIIGKPNVGKSSLMNALVGHERAIVSPQPGTTRDFIEEQVQIGGIWFRVIDTAGIRHALDDIEQHGLERTRLRIQDADVLVFMLDASSPKDEMDDAIAQECLVACDGDRHKKVIVVHNKIDLPGRLNGELSLQPTRKIRISALTGEGVPALMDTLAKLGKQDFVDQHNGVSITNLRQKNALERALGFVQQSQNSCGESMSGEFIARDLRAASDELGALVGEISSDVVLEEIFASFCIGK